MAPVTKTGIVTDSTACLPRRMRTELGIEIVPVEVIVEGKAYRDGVDISCDEFYRMLKEAKRLPTTSPAPPGVYLETFQHLGQRVDSIVCITVTSRLSAMYDSARAAVELAQKALPDKAITLLDSQTAAMAEGFVVLAAARASAAGRDLSEVLAAAQAVMPKVRLIAMLDTLYYLARGGRVPKAVAWGASLLQIKPILKLEAGEVHLLERARTKQRAVGRILEIMAQDINPQQPLHASVFHAAAPREAAELREIVLTRFRPDELFFTEFTPVMGAHTGPGVLGVAFYSGE